VLLIIKTSAYCCNNNCVIINMHGKTTIKTIRNVLFYTHRPRQPMAKVLYFQCHNCIVLHSMLLAFLHRMLQYERTPKQNEYLSHKLYETKSFISKPIFFYIHKFNCRPFMRNCTFDIPIWNWVKYKAILINASSLNLVDKTIKINNFLKFGENFIKNDYDFFKLWQNPLVINTISLKFQKTPINYYYF
jgi:hypothetical protein